MTIPFQHTSLSLSSSAVAGFVGGDESVAAMATMHIYAGRKFLGWYNAPGSYETARRFLELAKSKTRDGMLPGVSADPASLTGHHDKRGPRYVAAKSGTALPETGPCAYLFAKECEEREPEYLDGRETSRVSVTVADLRHVPNPHITPALAKPYAGLFASIPILTSVGTCAASAYFDDWACASMILLGTVVGGLSSWTIGSGQLTFTHPKPAVGSPVGDGWLRGEREIVVLKGAEAAVNTVTRGRFALRFSEADFRSIRVCAMLLIIQFLAQLFVVPQGTVFGQTMFITSIAVSWAYNALISSSDKEQVQRDMLRTEILGEPLITKYSLGTWTTAVVFVLLVARPDNVEKKLNKFIPNDTRVWQAWKATVLARIGGELRFGEADYAVDGLDASERTLLIKLYGDAEAAYEGYQRYLAVEQFSMTGKSSSVLKL